MLFSSPYKRKIPSPENSLLGREEEMQISGIHYVNGNTIKPPFSSGLKLAMFGLGCFWGAERIFWQTEGVFSTAVGYSAGHTRNPTYEEVCSGRTGHNEVVLVVFDPTRITFVELLSLFFESHDPTQGMRQGNDIGTQYRSGIYVSDKNDHEFAVKVRAAYQKQLLNANYNNITTEIKSASVFYYAEEYHQQYLAKNPNGYCGVGGTGILCSVD
ncbi:MAG: peptide-methionine (S)-S-oxide reductase [Rhodospirillaceae bacterium]|nr:peptide-methionine (S)-S-oxide reductase [Rhodospirillaceae bacterium]